jgi:uncharacterized spore protein YtfJ
MKMKTFMVFLFVVSCVLGMSFPALAQDDLAQSAKFIEPLVSQLKTLLNANNVLGSPLEFEGTKIIPVVGYGFGFGGGSGMGHKEEGQGTGVGGGGGVMPVSFLVITKAGEVKVVAAKKGELGEIVQALAPLMIEAMKAKQAQQQAKPETPPAEQPKQ